MSHPVFFLDVNIPMYAAGVDHALKPACVWIMEGVAEGRIDVAIDTEIVQEILHRYGAIGQPRVGITMASNLLDLVPRVYPINIGDIRQAIELFDAHCHQGIIARDVLHAAVMRNNGLTHILSADHYFDRIEGMIRVGVTTADQVRLDLIRLAT